MSKTFTADEAATITATTRNQIDYLSRTGVVAPSVPASRRGVPRLYDLPTLMLLAIAGQLLNAKITIQHVSEALDKVREQWSALRDRESRAEYGVLVLFRTHSDQRAGEEANLHSQLFPSDLKDLAEMVAGGIVVYAVVPVAYIMTSLEDQMGERL